MEAFESSKVIKIGVIAPSRNKNGDTDHHGEGHIHGVKAAFEDMKEYVEGKTGYRLELLIRDSSATETEETKVKALRLARELVEKDGVVAILGAVYSSSTLAIRQYIESLEENNAVLITSSSTHRDITIEPNNWTFRNNISDYKNTKSLAEYVKEKGIKKVGVFYANNVWGEGVLKDFKDNFNSNGSIIFSEAVERDRKRFKDTITYFVEKEVEAIFMFLWDDHKYHILLDKFDLKSAQSLPVFTIGIPHRLSKNDREVLKGLTAVSAFYDDPKSGAIKKAKEKLQRYNSIDDELNFNSSRAMESTWLLMNAIVAAGSDDAAAIRDEVRNTEYEGMNYKIEFDKSTGDLLREESFFLNYYGKWLNLNDNKVFYSPIAILVMSILSIGVIFIFTSRYTKLSRDICFFLSALPATVIFYFGNSSGFLLIGIGETLETVDTVFSYSGDFALVASAYSTGYRKLIGRSRAK